MGTWADVGVAVAIHLRRAASAGDLVEVPAAETDFRLFTETR